MQKFFSLGLTTGVTPKLDLVLIPSGIFLMGSDNGDIGEKPVHKVKISKPFYMGKCPVTQAQWKQVMGKNRGHFKGRNLPVKRVSWNDAQEFCKRLGKQTKKLVRLPTEAEWEYACRAGSQANYCSGDSEEDLKRVAWCSENSGDTTHPVGQKEPNKFGLYDMHGNVWEWCQDWYSAYEPVSKAKTVTNPQGPASGVCRVLRGGSWCCGPRQCRAAIRFGVNPDYRVRLIGFRVVVETR